MKFMAVEAVLPSLALTNDDVLKQIISASSASLSALAQARLAVAFKILFDRAGTQVRYVRAQGESAADLTCRAGRKALEAATLSPTDIDLLMYVGVGRGFIEPATANVFQDRLGLKQATCFDVLDACASWLRALHIAHAFLRCGLYRHIMILNGEFNVKEYTNFTFGSTADLHHNFAPFTIGEAATATIVGQSTQDAEYHATFRNWGALRHLCMIPLPNIRDYNGASTPAHARALAFYSYSRELFDQASTKLVAHFKSDALIHQYRPDIAFGHAASDAAAEQIARECGAAPSLFYRTHARFGNTVSASVPLAIASALHEGKLQDDMKIMIGMASAGMSTAWARFRFNRH